MDDRYSLPEMRSVWGEQNRLDLWAKIEMTALRVAAPEGIAEQAYTAYQFVQVPDVKRVEQHTRHDVEAFLQVWASYGSHDVKRWLHYGLTSSDVVDTTLMLQLKAAHELIEHRIGAACNAMVPSPHIDLVHLARTHGQPATVTPFRKKWDFHLTAGRRWMERWHRADTFASALSGPTGDFTVISREQSRQAMVDLGLEHDEFPVQIVARDGIAHWASMLADIATWVEAVAIDIRLLAHGSVGEVSEGRLQHQVGSTAMPHKRNPIFSENLCGLARMVRANADAVRLGQIQWHEHDLAHSSVERVALRDAFVLVDFMLDRLRIVLLNLELHPERMQANIGAVPAGHLSSFEDVQHLVREDGLTRRQARARIDEELFPDKH